MNEAIIVCKSWMSPEGLYVHTQRRGNQGVIQTLWQAVEPTRTCGHTRLYIPRQVGQEAAFAGTHHCEPCFEDDKIARW